MARHETDAERLDRNVAELLQELRVASVGVQVLFAFLLSLPFSSRFSDLGPGQRSLYQIDLVVCVVAIVLLGGPVAYHRFVFRLHEKQRLVRAANMMALGGLAFVAIAVTLAIALSVSYVDPDAVVWITALTGLLFALAWLAVPLHARRARPK